MKFAVRANIAAILLTLVFFQPITANAQQKCMSHQNLMKHAANNPDFSQHLIDAENALQKKLSKPANRSKATLITIPVVVHVVYHTSEENISVQQIQSQIDALNADFQLMNADKLSTSHPFYNDVADCQIEFCLTKTDPDGNEHSGITRTYTDSIYYTGNGGVKFSEDGGHDNWDPNKFLNLWVCNFDDDLGLLGYASFPSELEDYPDEDGVVVNFRCFGTTGTAGTGDYAENKLGRTATHEIGHWLSLNHIWGDEECGDDYVNDTPPQEWDNSGCPTFPYNDYNSCGSDENGEMFMNYMDYVDDPCMVMFTKGQSARIRASIDTFRSAFFKTPACSTASSLPNAIPNYLDVNVYPNPNSGSFLLDIQNITNDFIEISILNNLGQNIYSSSVNNTNQTKEINLPTLPSGIYILLLNTETLSTSKQIIISK